MTGHAGSGDLKQALEVVLPDFKAQIDLAREQTQQEVTRLVEVFTSLSTKLTPKKDPQTTVTSTVENGQQGNSPIEIVHQEYKSTLDDMLQRQTELSESVLRIQHQFSRISRYNEDLVSIGEQNNLLAIKAYSQMNQTDKKPGQPQPAIDAGIPTKIIMRSIQTLQIAQDIGTQMQQAKKEIANIIVQVQAMAAGQQSTFALVERLIRTMASNIQQPASHNAASGISMTDSIQQDLNTILVSFQFQDKVCQIMNSVTNSMNDFMQFVNQTCTNESGTNSIDLDKLKKMLEANYITGEQFGDDKPAGNDDVIFF